MAWTLRIPSGLAVCRGPPLAVSCRERDNRQLDVLQSGGHVQYKSAIRADVTIEEGHEPSEVSPWSHPSSSTLPQRRLSRTSESRAAPRSAWLQAVPAGSGGAQGGTPAPGVRRGRWRGMLGRARPAGRRKKCFKLPIRPGATTSGRATWEGWGATAGPINNRVSRFEPIKADGHPPLRRRSVRSVRRRPPASHRAGNARRLL